MKDFEDDEFFDDLIAQMTLSEKASLCSGADGNHTKSIERLGIPSLFMVDGPMGLRKEREVTENEMDWFNSYPATCLPSPSLLASTFSEDCAREYGEVLGGECAAENIDILLAPAMNIKRNPFCGRSFEYFSEDTSLTSKMATAVTGGIQKYGVGACLKHFAVNSQETDRLVIDASIDRRAFNEVYLKAFKTCVKQQKPYCVMLAYNKVNGEYCSQNGELLNKILRDEWGFDGFTVSDWGAVDERVKGLKAGLNLEMPSSYGFRDNQIETAVKSGELREEVLDISVKEYLKVLYKVINGKQRDYKVDYKKNHDVCRKIAEEGIVLIKNKDKILPIINNNSKIAIIGEYAKIPRYKGGGSSNVNPIKMEIPLNELEKNYKNTVYFSEITNYSELSNFDYLIMFCALNLSDETEGRDRDSLTLDSKSLNMIKKAFLVNQNLIVVLNGGGMVDLNFAKDTKGLLYCSLAGQAFASALTNIISGKVNPSGRLNESIPRRKEDILNFENITGNGKNLYYSESIFVGYKFYDQKKIKTLFPFMFGLSYTDFQFSNFKVSTNNDEVVISVQVKNIGDKDGKTIAAVYFSKNDSHVKMPKRQLIAFKKVHILSGSQSYVKLKIPRNDLAYYDIFAENFIVEGGKYQFYICENSSKVLCKTEITVLGDEVMLTKLDRNLTILQAKHYKNGQEVIQKMIDLFILKSGIDLPVFNMPNDFTQMVVNNHPLRALINFFRGKITDDDLNDYIEKYNAEFIGGENKNGK